MSTLSPRPLPPTLLPSINTLLASLNLPFTIDNPTDLTPSLLLAIFESLINARLPITQTVRQSRTRDAQSRAMLVLLGVLECDVLRGGTDAEQSGMTDLASTSNSGLNMDDSALGGAGGVSVDGWVDEIGLGDVDPEKLADGGWNETIFVGELLCWLARRKGVLPRIKSSNRSSQPRSLYSNHHSYGDEEGETADFSTSLLLRPSPAQRPRSIQEQRVPSPSLDDDADDDGEDEPDPDYSAFSHITDIPRHPLVHSPEPSLSISGTTGTDLSIRARSVSSRTSVSNPPDDIDEYDDVSHDTIQSYGGRRLIEDAEEEDDLPPTFHPRCIHELDDPSYIRALAGPSDLYSSASRADDGAFSFPQGGFGGEDDDEQENDPYAPPTPTPQRVRLTGWIDRVDANTELSQFAASRSRSLYTYSKLPPQTQSPSYSQFQSHKSRGWDTDIVSQSNQKSSSSSKSKSMFRTNVSSPPPPNPISAPRSRHISPSPPAPSRHPLPTSSSSSKYQKSTTPLSRPSFRSPSPLSDLDPDPDPDLDEYADPDAEPENSDNDAPFEISFSVNTSTPAKPRPPCRSQVQRSSAHPHQSQSQSQNQSQSISQSQTKLRYEVTGKGPGARTEYISSVGRRRSPSYTPSPPSFSAPGSGSLRGGLDGGGSGSLRAQRMESRMDTQYYPPPTSLSSRPTTSSSSSLSAKRTNATATNASLGSGNGRSPPPGSTSRTSTLLTERARLLTELAALKRARAASGGGGGGAGSSASAGVAGMSHVGVGVR